MKCPLSSRQTEKNIYELDLDSILLRSRADFFTERKRRGILSFTRFPKTRMLPLQGARRPAAVFRQVVFPEPFPPNKQKISFS